MVNKDCSKPSETTTISLDMTNVIAAFVMLGIAAALALGVLVGEKIFHANNNGTAEFIKPRCRRRHVVKIKENNKMMLEK